MIEQESETILETYQTERADKIKFWETGETTEVLTWKNTSAGGVSPRERYVLDWLYYNLDGANWGDNTNWVTDEPIENWYGVTVEGGHVTEIDLTDNDLNGVVTNFPFYNLPYLKELSLWENAALTGIATAWTLPTTLKGYRLHGTAVTLDLSSVTFPAGIEEIEVGDNVNVSGDITSLTLPAKTFDVGATSVTGSVAGWTFPDTFWRLYIQDTALTGDVASWDFSSTSVLWVIMLSDCPAITGDISGWTLPSTLFTFGVSRSGVSGDLSGMTIPAAMTFLSMNDVLISELPNLASAVELWSVNFADLGLSQAQVDAALLEIYTNRAIYNSFYTQYAPIALNINGTNAAPSGIYQDGDPPTTGQEYIYELENDPETEGFEVWGTTYTP